LYQDAIDAGLLHPLEMQIYNALACVVVKSGFRAAGKGEVCVEEAFGRILAHIRHEINVHCVVVRYLELHINKVASVQEFIPLPGPGVPPDAPVQ
jgi:hypothetical protein